MWPLTVPAYAGTWKYVNDQWKYQKGTNKFAYNEWIKDNGKYYYIGNDGIMKNRLAADRWPVVLSGPDWCKADRMVKEMTMENGISMYPNGAMAVNTVIDGRTIGEDGVWVPNEGDTEPANSMDLENGYLVQNLEGITKKDYTIIASGKTAAGSRWGNAIRLKGKGSYVQCNTNGEYRMLSGVFGPSSQFDSALLARVTVYGDDDQILYTSPDTLQ